MQNRSLLVHLFIRLKLENKIICYGQPTIDNLQISVTPPSNINSMGYNFNQPN